MSADSSRRASTENKPNAQVKVERDNASENQIEAWREGSEPKTVLIDGFNVLHTVLFKDDRPDGWWKQKSRDRLLARVSRWHRPQDDLWVAFDGGQPAESIWIGNAASVEAPKPPRPTVHCLFAESADDWLVRRARRTDAPDSIVVVSADRQVAGRARSAGVNVMSPWSLIGGCPEPQGDIEDDPS